MASYIASGTSRLRSLSHRAVAEIVAFVVAAVTITVLAISLAGTSTSSAQPGPDVATHSVMSTPPPDCHPTQVVHAC